MEKLKVTSLFSGIGAFEQALTNIGIDYELVNFCEVDKYAIKSYCAIHNINPNLNLGDITKINLYDILDMDLITHGSPCTDFSIAGKQEGGNEGSDTRSSLMWNTVEIIILKKPKYVIWENVKNVLSPKHKHNFEKYISKLEELGYNNYYKVLNSKHFNVPQNRERLFVVSIRNDIDCEFNFPTGETVNVKLKDILEDNVDSLYNLNEEYSERFLNSNLKMKGDIKVIGTTVNPEAKGTNSRHWVHDTDGIMGIIDATTYKQPKQILIDNPVRIGNIYGEDKGTGFAGNVWDKEAISPTITTCQGGNRQPMIIIDKSIKNCVAKNFERELDKISKTKKDIYQAKCDSGWQDNKIGINVSQTIRAENNFAPVLDNNFIIRKLTPLECWRLQGFKDEQFHKAKNAEISNTQLYKQAGNSITVNVLEAIFKNLFKA